MTIDLKSLVRSMPDYPKPGIIFRDITSLIEDSEGFRESVEQLASAHRGIGHYQGGGDRGAGVHIRRGGRDRAGRGVCARAQGGEVTR